MENPAFNLVRQILKSPLFLAQSTDQKQATLDEIVKTGEITRQEVFTLINEEMGLQEQSKIDPRVAQLLNSFDYNTFVKFILAGDIKGKDLISLCNTSQKFSDYCNRSFQLRNANGDLVGQPQEQYLFRLLLNEMGISIFPGKTPKETYIGKTIGGRVISFGGFNTYSQLGFHNDLSGLPRNVQFVVYNRQVISTPTEIPKLKGIIQVAAGERHSLSLDNQGRVWGFGSNQHGEIGITPIKANTLPTIIPGLNKIVQVAAGYDFSLCLDDQGRVWGFGRNRYGQLGFSDSLVKHAPSLNPDLQNIVQISTGRDFSLCLDNQGRVWVQGRNEVGQLGVGDNNNRLRPVINPNLRNIVQVSCGAQYSLCIDNQGQVWSFGYNGVGQLGLGHRNNVNLPVMVPNLHNIIQVSGSINHTLCLTQQGQVLGFGHNGYGELGPNGVGSSRDTVGDPIPGLPNIVQISAGEYYSLCLDNQGQVWVFGGDGLGGLGLDPLVQTGITHPYMHPNLRNIIQVVGKNHTLCITI